jgi:hypothetical protein
LSDGIREDAGEGMLGLGKPVADRVAQGAGVPLAIAVRQYRRERRSPVEDDKCPTYDGVGVLVVRATCQGRGVNDHE